MASELPRWPWLGGAICRVSRGLSIGCWPLERTKVVPGPHSAVRSTFVQLPTALDSGGTMLSGPGVIIQISVWGRGRGCGSVWRP